MFDPFMMGMAGLTGFSNPEAFANAMAMSGVSPTGFSNPNAPASLMGDPLAGFFTPSQSPGMVGAIPGAPAAPGLTPESLAGILQGVKVPQADNKPIMHAGVAGAQKAPTSDLTAVSRGPQAVDAILRAILGGGGQNPLRVPSLGELLKGV